MGRKYKKNVSYKRNNPNSYNKKKTLKLQHNVKKMSININKDVNSYKNLSQNMKKKLRDDIKKSNPFENDYFSKFFNDLFDKN